MCVFYADRKSKMATTAGHRLTLHPMGKCSNAFFSETTNMVKAKLYMNVHWMVLYKVQVFCSDMNFKMMATAGLSLTLDPMGKVSQNASSLKPLGQFKPSCPRVIIGRSSTKFRFFMPIGNPRVVLYLCVGVSILPLSTILIFDFGIVPTVCFLGVFLLHFINNIFAHG